MGDLADGANVQDYWLQYGVVGATVIVLAYAVVHLYVINRRDRADASKDKAAALAEQRAAHEAQLAYERDLCKQTNADQSRRAERLEDELRRLEIDYRNRGMDTLSGATSALTDALRELRRASRGE